MALAAQTVWEIRTGGAQTNGGGFRWLGLVNATYKWTASGSGTNEYYCEAAAGGDPSLTEAKCCCTDGNFTLATNGTLGSLNAGEWDWGDNDTLGYSTVYVRLASGLDPDTMKARGRKNYVAIGYGGGYDYSQQNAAQLSLTDLYFTSGTTLKSDTGGFTALMVGNIIRIASGTHFTAGWYEIATYVGTSEVTLDRAPASEDTSGHKDAAGKVGGAFLLGGSLDDDFGEGKVAGNMIFIAAGTYTLGESFVPSVNGSSSAGYIMYLGYNATRGDTPTGTNRPLIDTGASYYVQMGSRYLVAHLRFTGSPVTYILSGGSYGKIINVKVTNTKTGAAAYGISVGTSGAAIGCEASSTGNGASAAIASGIFVYGCYVHDTPIGINPQTGGMVLNCIAAGCTTYGIDREAAALVANCTTYDCAIGYNAALDDSVLINCVDEGSTTSISEGTPFTSMVMFCCLHGTTDFSDGLVMPTIGNVFGDPGLNDPANEDFSITSADTNVYELGHDVSTYTGATV